MKLKLMLMVLLVAAMVIVGCQATKDPVTGDTHYQPTEEVVKAIDTVGVATETLGPGITAATTAINPVIGVIVGLVVGIITSLYGTYKKWKIPLTEKSDMYDKLAAGARAAADVIERVVKPNKALWSEEGPKLKVIENAGAIMPDKIG